jgi:uncharacterized protein (DUF433 family)
MLWIAHNKTDKHKATMMIAEPHLCKDRIVQDPTILAGKPVVKGTRIPVALVLAKLAYNPELQELFADYPRLTIDDVKACLAYAQMLVEKQDNASRKQAQHAGV